MQYQESIPLIGHPLKFQITRVTEWPRLVEIPLKSRRKIMGALRTCWISFRSWSGSSLGKLPLLSTNSYSKPTRNIARTTFISNFAILIPAQGCRPGFTDKISQEDYKECGETHRRPTRYKRMFLSGPPLSLL
jgi:hypothetical protein